MVNGASLKHRAWLTAFVGLLTWASRFREVNSLLQQHLSMARHGLGV